MTDLMLMIMDYPDNEFEYRGPLLNGFLALAIIFLGLPLCALIVLCWLTPWIGSGAAGAVLFILAVLFIFGVSGLFQQEPNVARVMIFFGKYVGTCRRVGFYWANPFVSRKKLSLRIRNMDVEPIKVNDKVGNPVLIGMVLVWKVKDTYRVIFDLDSASLGSAGTLNSMALDHFVRIQSDAALREVTGHFAYDQTDADSHELTLRDGGDEINELLEHKLNERLAMAGIEVVEARLNYLAYAPEIAAVMLRRQQAAAIITAREKIVEGAVSMVEMAIKRLEDHDIVNMTDQQRAAMVSNLMVVLCSDEPAAPIVPAGV